MGKVQSTKNYFFLLNFGCKPQSVTEFKTPIYLYTESHIFHTIKMATFVVPVTILVTDLTNPENLTNDLIILNSIDNKQIQS